MCWFTHKEANWAWFKKVEISRDSDAKTVDRMLKFNKRSRFSIPQVTEWLDLLTGFFHNLAHLVAPVPSSHLAIASSERTLKVKNSKLSQACSRKWKIPKLLVRWWVSSFRFRAWRRARSRGFGLDDDRPAAEIPDGFRHLKKLVTIKIFTVTNPVPAAICCCNPAAFHNLSRAIGIYKRS